MTPNDWYIGYIAWGGYPIPHGVLAEGDGYCICIYAAAYGADPNGAYAIGGEYRCGTGGSGCVADAGVGGMRLVVEEAGEKVDAVDGGEAVDVVDELLIDERLCPCPCLCLGWDGGAGVGLVLVLVWAGAGA